MEQQEAGVCTPNVARLREMLSTSEGQASYIEWFSHPMTQLLLLAGREISRPVRVAGDLVKIAQAQAETVGMNCVLDFFLNPRSGAFGLSEGRSPLVADYGGRKLVETEKEA